MSSSQNRQFWQEHLQQWQNTAMTQSAYCRHHALCLHKFGYYKKVLSPDVNTLVSVPPKPNGFIRVAVPAPVPFDEYDDPLTLHFSNGVHLSGISASNLDAVKQLVLVLS
jgi:hypothetical protein